MRIAKFEKFEIKGLIQLPDEVYLANTLKNRDPVNNMDIW